jgi:hypothetical protein
VVKVIALAATAARIAVIVRTARRCVMGSSVFSTPSQSNARKIHSPALSR